MGSLLRSKRFYGRQKAFCLWWLFIDCFQGISFKCQMIIPINNSRTHTHIYIYICIYKIHGLYVVKLLCCLSFVAVRPEISRWAKCYAKPSVLNAAPSPG